MKTQTSFVRTERAVHLDAEPAINLNLAFVIDPRNAELNHPLRFNETFQDLSVSIFLLTFNRRSNRFEYFSDCLKELRLIRVALLNNFENLLHQVHKGVTSAGYFARRQIKTIVRDKEFESPACRRGDRLRNLPYDGPDL
jgi:hypothetical protein